MTNKKLGIQLIHTDRGLSGQEEHDKNLSGTGPGLSTDWGLLQSRDGVWYSHGKGPGLVKERALNQKKLII